MNSYSNQWIGSLVWWHNTISVVSVGQDGGRQTQFLSPFGRLEHSTEHCQAEEHLAHNRTLSGRRTLGTQQNTVRQNTWHTTEHCQAENLAHHRTLSGRRTLGTQRNTVRQKNTWHTTEHCQAEEHLAHHRTLSGRTLGTSQNTVRQKNTWHTCLPRGTFQDNLSGSITSGAVRVAGKLSRGGGSLVL